MPRVSWWTAAPNQRLPRSQRGPATPRLGMLQNAHCFHNRRGVESPGTDSPAIPDAVAISITKAAPQPPETPSVPNSPPRLCDALAPVSEPSKAWRPERLSNANQEVLEQRLPAKVGSEANRRKLKPCARAKEVRSCVPSLRRRFPHGRDV